MAARDLMLMLTPPLMPTPAVDVVALEHAKNEALQSLVRGRVLTGVIEGVKRSSSWRSDTKGLNNKECPKSSFQKPERLTANLSDRENTKNSPPIRVGKRRAYDSTKNNVDHCISTIALNFGLLALSKGFTISCEHLIAVDAATAPSTDDTLSLFNDEN
uniref:Uncharacterized protein n=1 Tax=Romanomermis culicivorax TaxID=13658 RepID=A0A915J125_ROMCU